MVQSLHNDAHHAPPDAEMLAWLRLLLTPGIGRITARKLLAKGESVDTVLEALARGLTQKMMHGTLAELHAGDADTRAATAHTVSRLFLRSDPRR